MALTVFALSSAAVLSVVIVRTLNESQAARNSNQKLVETEKMGIRGLGLSEPPSKDFAANLPLSVDVQQLLDDLQRQCLDSEVVMAGVEVQHGVRTNEELARRELTFSLRGTYPNLKRVVAGVLDRFPNSTTTRIAIRRGSQSANADATFALAVWARADTAAASPQTSRSKAAR